MSVLSDVSGMAVRLIAVALVAACAHRGGPATANAQPRPSNLNADSLIVSIEDVRRIAGTSDLDSVSQFDVGKPGGLHQYDAQYPSQCHILFDQDVAFGGDYTQFRSADYAGAGNREVTQAVGVYPSRDVARAAFDRAAAALTGCSDQHVPDFSFTARKLDPSTVAGCFDGECQYIFRVRDSVLIEVDVVHFDNGQRIASTVLQTISDRIPAT